MDKENNSGTFDWSDRGKLFINVTITGGTFVDANVISPDSGVTNMSSNIAYADHAKDLKYANP